MAGKRDSAQLLVDQAVQQGFGPVVTDPMVLAQVASLLPRAKAAA